MGQQIKTLNQTYLPPSAAATPSSRGGATVLTAVRSADKPSVYRPVRGS
jgi:hypothetical protein